MKQISENSIELEKSTLREYLRLLWQRRWFIFIVTGVFLALSTTAAFLLKKEYNATALLAPNQASLMSGEGALGSLEARFGGLASLVGMSATRTSTTAEDIAVLQSRALTYAYIKKNKLLPILFPNDWNAARHAWKNGRVRTLWDGDELFAHKVRAVTINGRTGLVTVDIRWDNPKLAAQWANGIVKMTNKYLRARAIRHAQRDIKYLYQQAETTHLVEAKQAIYHVLEMEMNREMLARGTSQYAFTVIDPAVPPQIPSFPRKLLFILGGLAAGLLVSLTLIHLRYG